MNNKLLKPKEVADFLQVSPKTLANMRSLGDGPKFFKTSKKVVRYPADALENYINKNTHGGRRW